MSLLETGEVTERAVWEDFLLGRKPGTFLQSWNWGEVNKEVGYKIRRLGFFKGGKLMGVALLIHQPAKRGKHYLVPGGPVLDFGDRQFCKYVFSQIKRKAKEDGVWFVRIRPDVKDDPALRVLMKEMGLLPAPMHVHGENTLVLDISRTEAELMAGMRKTTRYSIRKSMSEGYQVTASEDTSHIENLYELQAETVKRHKFVGFQKKLFWSELSIFSKDREALLFECKKGRELLASAIVVFYGEKAFYHYSGSSQASRGTNASYCLQWEIIKKAKELGYKMYDFWGIAPRDDPKHRFWGVTVFKKGFGGERIDWLHAHDMPLSPWYYLTYLFETGRRVLRRL
jgi:lipid II:glycine glycyltransferase (peptidoglycan interpeptide bridge formation enzyme)